MAAARFDDFSGELPAAPVVLTTTCDQIRYAAALLQHQGRLPVFLLHVPRTWQTAAVRAFYREELGRLGRFLVACGGTAPTDDALSQTMLRYDRAQGVAPLRRRRCRPASLCAGGRRRPRRSRRRRDAGEVRPRRASVPVSRVPRSSVLLFPWHLSAGRCPRAITNC